MCVNAEKSAPPPPEASDQVAAYWRAANYLGAVQIYLQANFLLEEPLRPEHVKPRLLGHWGTVPGINFIYAHLNRVIREQDASVLLVTGPGHSAAANLANLYLEGSLAEFCPEFTPDRDGLSRLVRGFSWPGGFVETAVDGPDAAAHRQMAAALDAAYRAIRGVQGIARQRQPSDKPQWPLVILRSPKGWTGIQELEGEPIEGSYRSHQVPTDDVATGRRGRRLLRLPCWR
jgi:phosphoketolase